MKKIFTLLFCLAAVAVTANANTNYEQCINVLLGNEVLTPALATTLDANHDGEISIADVTTMIRQEYEQKKANCAPAKNPKDEKIQSMIDQMLDGTPPTPSITDLTDAINEEIKKN